jgi:cephalosporin hydroxylase
VSTQIPNERRLIEAMAADPEIADLRRRLMSAMGRYKYSYNWHWWGRPIIQLPQDVMAMQMLILEHAPDLVIETGIAHGGSLVFHASLLELLGRGRVVGVDVEIRAHNRQALDAHPMRKRITLIEGSSVDPAVVAKVAAEARGAGRVFVCLDSSHTAEHVAHELELYSPLVRPGGYLVVFDTAIEDLPKSEFPDRPWGPGNSPKTAVSAFLRKNSRFEVDRELEQRLLFSVAPGGYLRCVA